MSNNFCPICGGVVPKGTSLIAVPGVPGYPQHRCKQSALTGIDAAGKTDRTECDKRHFNGRLRDGFALTKLPE